MKINYKKIIYHKMKINQRKLKSKILCFKKIMKNCSFKLKNINNFSKKIIIKKQNLSKKIKFLFNKINN